MKRRNPFDDDPLPKLLDVDNGAGLLKVLPQQWQHSGGKPLTLKLRPRRFAASSLVRNVGQQTGANMTLPYDYARCAGTTHETCQWCRRRDPGREQWQTYIAPVIDMMTGQCPNFIEPPKVYATSNTVPNAPGKPTAANEPNEG